MKLSADGVDFIMAEEGTRLTAYRDVAGVWTIGVGHTGDDVHDGLVISAARAEELFRSDVERFERGVDAAIHRPDVAQHEFDAFVSLAFNIGLGAFRGSTALRRYNDGDRRGAAVGITMFHNAGGRPNAGLLARRTREVWMFAGRT
jgi:lysozyme